MAANLFSSAPRTGNVICAVPGVLVSPSSYDLSGRAPGARSGETLETSCRNRQRRRDKGLRVRADPRQCLFSGPAAVGVGKPTVEVTPGGTAASPNLCCNDEWRVGRPTTAVEIFAPQPWRVRLRGTCQLARGRS
jgi:hypothetical protein